MIELVTVALILVAFVAAVVVLFLALQMGAALLPDGRSVVAPASPFPSVAVVAPAHNEEALISETVHSIISQMPPSGRLLVIADNCTDNTALNASRAGAEVAIRRDASRIGKGYALDHGVRILRADPPDVVIFVDADCKIGAGSLHTLAMRCVSTGGPVQARYIMQASPSPRPADKVSQFAWIIKTLVRPLGSTALGLPCQMMGSGMAIPFALLGELNLATGHLAEDQKLGAELALIGKAPQFIPEAQVFSQLPREDRAKRSQRTRWEHGHFAIIGQFFLPLIARAASKRSLQLFAFALDLCIPPLSLLALSLALIECMTLTWFLVAGPAGPLVVSSATLACFATSISVAWWRFGEDSLSPRELAAVPAYCLLRIPSFIRFFVNRQIGWVGPSDERHRSMRR